MKDQLILIVEDNKPLREGICLTLEQEGYRALGAGDGEEALAKMEQTDPDLIISDIAMPRMDGYAFFAAVRRRQKWLAIPFIFLTARGEKNEIITGKSLGVEDYLVKPVAPDEIVAIVNSRLERARQLELIQLQQSYESSLTVLANAIELRDPYTRGHVERVTAYALAIAYRLGWRGRQLEDLRFGGILHDIGKIHISESVLCKTGPLTNGEWEKMKRHPILGEQMLRGIAYLQRALPAVRHHHERWDGQGYPDGLAGEAIPIEARIIAIADSFDAMTSTRTYRAAFSMIEAYEEIGQKAGQQYDPALVKLFQEAWEAGQIHTIRDTLEPT